MKFPAGLSNHEDLGMCGGIIELQRPVAVPRQNCSIPHQNRSHRNLTAPRGLFRFLVCNVHEGRLYWLVRIGHEDECFVLIPGIVTVCLLLQRSHNTMEISIGGEKNPLTFENRQTWRFPKPAASAMTRP